MTKWATDIRWGAIVGAGMMAAILLIDAVIIALAIVQPLNIGTFVIGLAVVASLGLLGILGYWLYGLYLSGYSLDRNALIIHWGTLEQVIPTGQIERVLTGDELTGSLRFVGGMWPGHCVGYGESEELGPTLFYATVSPREQIYIVTPGLTYGISPADRDEFLASLHKRLQMGPTQVVEQSSRRPAFLDWLIWRDRAALILLGLGLLTVVGLVGLLCYHFPALPRLIPLHFDAAGNPDRLGGRGQIFILPLIGALAWLLNGGLGLLTYHRERMASYLLWGGAVLVQTLVWVAAVGLLEHL